MRMQLKQCGVVLWWLWVTLLLAACNSQSEAPQQVSAVGADAEATVAWDEVPGAASYNLYWNATGKASGADAGATNVTSPYTVTGLRNEATYYFRVTALSSTGESVASPSIVARTTAVKLQAIVVAPKGQAAVPYADMIAGTKQYFAATGVYPDGSTIDLSRAAKWSTSDSAVFTVIKEGRGAGLVTALQSSVGKVVAVSANYGGVQGSVNVNVGDWNVFALGITPHDPTIAPRTSLAFSTLAASIAGDQNITASAVWSSSNPGVAKISNDLGSEGVAKALSVGKTVITAAFNGMTVESTLYVSDVALQAITIAPAALSIPRGLTQHLQANGSYSDGSTHDITDMVDWSTSNPQVARVESYPAYANAANLAGTVSTGFPLSVVGSSVITAQFQTLSASSVVTVTPAVPQSIQIAPAGVALTPGATQQLAMNVTYTDGSGVNNMQGAVWSSSNATAVQVDSSGLVTAIAPGQAAISVSHPDLPGLSAAANVAVRMTSVDHTQVTGACISCHDGTLATGKYSAHAPTTNLCETCHVSRVTWLVVQVDHTQVLGPCVNCHTPGGFARTAKLPTHMPSTNACDACHTNTVAWAPVVRVDHAQVLGTCVGCHDGTSRFARTARPTSHIPSSNACDTCHISTVSWLVVK